MPTYIPRAERIDLRFSLKFVCDDVTFTGSCLNISLTGLLARISGTLDFWQTGTLSLQAGTQVLVIEARVARFVGEDVGFAFKFNSDAERNAIAQTVAFASEKTGLVGRNQGM